MLGRLAGLILLDLFWYNFYFQLVLKHNKITKSIMHAIKQASVTAEMYIKIILPLV